MTDLLQRVEGEIQSRRLIPRGKKFLVAVSGGLDSMALLHALKLLSAKHHWQLVVAHFNHRLRGRASDADETLVRKTAAAMKLRMIAESANVKVFAAKSKLSLEMAARKLRHEFLARAAEKQNIKTIALAHQADDQVELFFLRLFRGTGGEGLAGMKWRSPSPADGKVAVVRPLLGFSKNELADFARENKIHFRDDATNLSADFLRNRIRNELLPLLRVKYQPALDKAVLRLMEIVGAEAECMGEAARSWERRHLAGVNMLSDPSRAGKMPALPERSFDRLPVAIQRRVLQSQLALAGVAPDFELIESLRHSADCFVSVGPNISVSRDEQGEIKLRAEAETQFNPEELPADLSGRSGQADFGELNLNWRIQSQKRFRSAGGPPASRRLLKHAGGPPALREFFDADKIGGKIVLRHWRPGDRFQPIGLKSAVKLQDLFVNAKIPRDRRRNLIVAEAADGEIFWVEGLRIGERFKLTPQTARKLVWKWSNLGV